MQLDVGVMGLAKQRVGPFLALSDSDLRPPELKIIGTSSRCAWPIAFFILGRPFPDTQSSPLYTIAQ